MRWQKLASCSMVSALAIPLFLSGCSGSGRTTVVQTWEDRPRFFTAEPGEEHSRFANVVWYDRPRFFTRAEGEEQSRFSEIWDDRPRIFTTETTPTYSATYPSTTYTTPTYGTTSTTYRTIPVESRPVESRTIIHDEHHKNCDCPHKHKVKTEKTYYYPTTQPTTALPAQPYPAQPSTTVVQERSTTTSPNVVSPSINRSNDNSFGSAMHRNVTDRDLGAQGNMRVELTSDVGDRSFAGRIANWPQDARVAAEAMQAKYGAPDSSTNDQLIWRDRDPFAEIVVFKNGTSHDYPNQHLDVLAHSIYFDIDAAKLDDLNDFRGNLKVDHNRGLLTAKCKDEAMNILALNLAHDVLTNEKSVVEANSFLMEAARDSLAGGDYLKELQFDVGVDIDESDNKVNNLNADVDTDTDVEANTDTDEP